MDCISLQFYFTLNRRKLADKNKAIFHKIPLKSKDNPIVKNDIKDIKIEVGKVTIYIPANEIVVIAAIIRELSYNV